MSKKSYYLLSIVFLLSMMSVRGMSQTDEGNAASVSPAHHTHVVKKAWNDTKQAVNKGAHATAHATGTAWRATKQGVSTGAHATARATGKAWHATKQGVTTAAHATARTTGKAWSGTKKAVSKGYNSTVHPHAKASDKDKVNHPEIKQEGETK